MTEQEARDFCASIKFCGALSLLGPRIRVWWPEGLVISLEVPERDGKPAVQSNAFEVVQHLPLEQAPKTVVLECVRAGLKMMLEHETDEGILYKGVRVYDPHRPELPASAIARADREEEEKLRTAAMPAPVFARDPYVDLHDDRFVVVGESPGVRALRDVGYIEGLDRQQITVIVDELADYAPPPQRTLQEWTRAYLRDPFGILPPKK